MLDKKKYIESVPEIHDELSKHFSPEQSMVIIDAGACEGEDSIRYGKLFPNARIFSFEPHPENVSRFRKNLKEYPNPNITIVTKALSNKSGRIKLYVSSGSPPNSENSENWDYGNKSHSILQPEKVTEFYPWLKFEETIDVDVITLSSYLLSNKIETVDFLHADIQGAEKLMLEGLGFYIHKLKCIWIEASNLQLYKNQILKDDLIKFLSNKGFCLQKDTTGKVDGDLFFVRDPQISKNTTQKRILNKFFRRLYFKENDNYKSFSQSGEDRIIRHLFEIIGINKPSYIDIGAFHPQKLNNTYLFYLTGSRGLNIEPNPSAIGIFNKTRPGDTNVQAGISDENGLMDFYEMVQPTLSTFSLEEAKKYEREFNIKTKSVKKIETYTLDTVIERYCNGLFPEFMSIDVEGFDHKIIKNMENSETLPIVICAETVHFKNDGFGEKNKPLIDTINNLGYQIFADTYINTIFLKNEFWQ